MKYNYIFLLDKEKDKPDAKIRLRVRWGSCVAQFSVGYRVDVDKWNNDSQRCKANTTHGKKKVAASIINREIQRIEDIVNDIFSLYDIKNAVPSEQEFKEEYNERNGKAKANTKNIFDYYNEFIISESREKGWTYATTQKHRTIKNHLFNFSNRLEFSDLNEKGINMFVDYLLNLTDDDGELTMKNTTIKKDVAILLWFLRWASDKGYNKETAHLTYKVKLKTVPKKIIFLDWDELMRMYNVEGIKDNERIANDRFLFSCFTSLRFSDMDNLKWNNVKDGYIEITSIKTNDPLIIELNKYSSSILERYKKASGSVFPRMSNQKMNIYIKRVAEAAGINTLVNITYFQGGRRIDKVVPKYELITTHAGRRTFICNALMLGIAPNIVMKWTGHANYNAMKPYIEIADKAKKSAMELFNR